MAQTIITHPAQSGCQGILPADRVCLFLAEYSAELFGSGATCIRLEHNVQRMADAFGMEVVMTIMPRHIHTTVCSRDRTDCYTFITDIRHSVISFDINTKLSELSWAVADGKVDFDEAQAELKRISRTAPIPKGAVLCLASVANACFCGLFGGDLAAMSMVFVATVIGYLIKQDMVSRKTDVRVIFMVCAFISTVVAGVLAMGGGYTSTSQVAVGTSVLYLVPGIPFLNSFSDMLAGHYICAFSRFMHAVILTASLSIGLCAGMLIMNVGMF